MANDLVLQPLQANYSFVPNPITDGKMVRTVYRRYIYDAITPSDIHHMYMVYRSDLKRLTVAIYIPLTKSNAVRINKLFSYYHQHEDELFFQPGCTDAPSGTAANDYVPDVRMTYRFPLWVDEEFKTFLNTHMTSLNTYTQSSSSSSSLQNDGDWNWYYQIAQWKDILNNNVDIKDTMLVDLYLQVELAWFNCEMKNPGDWVNDSDTIYTMANVQPTSNCIFYNACGIPGMNTDLNGSTDSMPNMTKMVCLRDIEIGAGGYGGGFTLNMNVVCEHNSKLIPVTPFYSYAYMKQFAWPDGPYADPPLISYLMVVVSDYYHMIEIYGLAETYPLDPYASPYYHTLLLWQGYFYEEGSAGVGIHHAIGAPPISQGFWDVDGNSGFATPTYDPNGMAWAYPYNILDADLHDSSYGVEDVDYFYTSFISDYASVCDGRGDTTRSGGKFIIKNTNGTWAPIDSDYHLQFTYGNVPNLGHTDGWIIEDINDTDTLSFNYITGAKSQGLALCKMNGGEFQFTPQAGWEVWKAGYRSLRATFYIQPSTNTMSFAGYSDGAVNTPTMDANGTVSWIWPGLITNNSYQIGGNFCPSAIAPYGKYTINSDNSTLRWAPTVEPFYQSYIEDEDVIVTIPRSLGSSSSSSSSESENISFIKTGGVTYEPLQPTDTYLRVVDNVLYRIDSNGEINAI